MRFIHHNELQDEQNHINSVESSSESTSPKFGSEEDIDEIKTEEKIEILKTGNSDFSWNEIKNTKAFMDDNHIIPFHIDEHTIDNKFCTGIDFTPETRIDSLQKPVHFLFFLTTIYRWIYFNLVCHINLYAK